MKRLFRAVASVSLAAGLSVLALPGAHAAEAPSAPGAAASPAVAVPTTGTVQEKVAALLAQSTLSQGLKDRITAAVAGLPADFDTKLARTREKYGLTGTVFDDITRGAIDGSQYQCGSTPLVDWLDGQVARMDLTNLLLLQFVGGLDAPTYDALLLGQSAGARFGYDGTYTNPLTVEMKKLKGFWDFDGNDIQLIPMHGAATFANLDHLTQVYEVTYGLSPEDAATFAALAKDIVDSDPGMDHGDNPIFSFNAFSFLPDETTPGLTRRIIVGDGVLKGQHEIGLSDHVAPQAVVAHEYGHQVQYAKGLMDNTDLTGPEATRRTELMADAFGTYFMVHSKGYALNAQRTLVDEQAFYNVGDCSYTSAGHHGTPNQRGRSAAWAASVVNAAPNQGHPLGGLAFDALFEKELPTLVAPDAGN